jgi:membrane protein implicated in regulation of membrane protease activity
VEEDQGVLQFNLSHWADCSISRMDASLAWAILGLALVIAELLTGTFYLLMLGVAAFGAAAAAWLALAFGPQIIVFALVAAIGCYGVHVYRARNRGEQMPPIDAGLPASFEQWIDVAERLARVRYRGATWDARVQGAEPIEPGRTVYVVNTNGNTLEVATKRPA